MSRLGARIVMDLNRLPDVIPPALAERFESELRWVAPPVGDRSFLDADTAGRIEVLVTGWGGPRLDAAALERLPALRLVAVASGSVRHIVTEEFWESGIPIVSAAGANALPVIDFSVAQIILGLKQTYRVMRELRQGGVADKSGIDGPVGTTVGIVSLGLIGRGVAERLASQGVDLLIYDPLVRTPPVGRAASLSEIFTRSQVVSVHTPLLPETVELVDGELIERMPRGGLIVNTSRGAILAEDDLVEVLARRPDLTAVLDVTVQEPLDARSALWELPNVVLTGHLAGSHGRERERLGELILDEVRRFRANDRLEHPIERAHAGIRA